MITTSNYEIYSYKIIYKDCKTVELHAEMVWNIVPFYKTVAGVYMTILVNVIFALSTIVKIQLLNEFKVILQLCKYYNIAENATYLVSFSAFSYKEMSLISLLQG